MRFRHFRLYLVIMRNYLAACTHVYLVACSSMRAYLVGLEALDLISVRASLCTCTAFQVCVRTDTTMDPRCVWAAIAYLINRLVCFISACISNSFGDFVPEEDTDFSSISKYILHLLKWKNTEYLWNVYENIHLYYFSKKKSHSSV